MLLVDGFPHFLHVAKCVMAVVVGERNEVADGRMSLEEWAQLLVEHKVDGCIRIVFVQGVQYDGGENGIAHLAESDDEYVHCVVCFRVQEGTERRAYAGNASRNGRGQAWPTVVLLRDWYCVRGHSSARGAR